MGFLMVCGILLTLPFSLVFIAADSYNTFFLILSLVIQILGITLYVRFHNRCRSWEGFGLFILGTGVCLYLFFYMMKRAAQSVISTVGSAFDTLGHDILVQTQMSAMNIYHATLQSATTGKVWSWDAQAQRVVLVPAETVSTTDPILFLETSIPESGRQVVYLLAKQHNRQSFATTTLGYVVERPGYLTVLPDSSTADPAKIMGATFVVGKLGNNDKTTFELFAVDGQAQRAIREGDAGRLESSSQQDTATMWNAWAIPTGSAMSVTY